MRVDVVRSWGLRGRRRRVSQTSHPQPGCPLGDWVTVRNRTRPRDEHPLWASVSVPLSEIRREQNSLRFFLPRPTTNIQRSSTAAWRLTGPRDERDMARSMDRRWRERMSDTMPGFRWHHRCDAFLTLARASLFSVHPVCDLWRLTFFPLAANVQKQEGTSERRPPPGANKGRRAQTRGNIFWSRELLSLDHCIHSLIPFPSNLSQEAHPGSCSFHTSAPASRSAGTAAQVVYRWSIGATVFRLAAVSRDRAKLRGRPKCRGCRASATRPRYR